jgi:hypothetical protein
MRWLVMVFALLGAGGSGLIGFIWRGEVDKVSSPTMTQIRASSANNPLTRERYKEVIALDNATYFLMAGAPFGLIGAFLAVSRRGILAFLVLLTAWVGPGVFLFDTLVNHSEVLSRWAICTSALIAAALFSLMIRPKKVIPEDERAYAGV